ncbi:hypothetical protein [Accumulibacter sp.]|uniref:hypothetical protein n=1 Tax=Accumulibacter sp. TaxID=2053492 RepID=UPI00262AEAE3|nr:hypothetical protein [Accumulibacter sp.]
MLSSIWSMTSPRSSAFFKSAPPCGAEGGTLVCCDMAAEVLATPAAPGDGAQAIESLAPEADPLMAFFLAFDPSVASRMKKIRPSWMRLSQQMNDQ